VPLLMYFALNGNLLVPPRFAQVIGDISTVAFWMGAAIAILRNRAHVHWELWTCRFGFIFMMYTLASSSWGTAPFLATLYPSITAVCTFLYFNYLLDRFSLNDFIRMMIWALGILVTLSVVVSVAFPSIGIASASGEPGNFGAWQGVFPQKNQLGIVTALGVAVALGFQPKSMLDRMWRFLLLFAAIICAYFSQSREAWAAIALELIFLLFMRILNTFKRSSRLPIIVAGMTSFLALAFVTYLNLDSVLHSLGRSRTLTGRLNIWTDSFLLIAKRPWLGYGPYGVWGTPFAWDVVVREGWNVTSSHNNYIEILLYFGIIGLCLFLPLLGSAGLYIFRAFLSYDLRRLEVLVYIMIGLLTTSVAAPVFLYYPAIGMILLMYCVSRLEQVEKSGFMKLGM
jgi:exopolysaccharide production protein ExoQ